MDAKLISAVVSLFSLSFSAVAEQSFVPYFGVDVKQNNMEFKQSTGDKLVQTNYPQGNLFAGINLNGCLSLEFGYESTVKKTRAALVPADANFFGDTNRTGVTASTQTRTRVAGPHFNIVGAYPIFEEYCVNLFGSFGLANLKFKSRLDYTFPPDPEVSTHFFSKSKLLPRVTLGVQHAINNNLGVRAMATWEKTSSFKNIYNNTGRLYMRPKDSRSLGVGVFYSF